MVDEPATEPRRAERLTADQRRRRVAEMYAADYSVRETAKALDAAGYPNCSATTIQRDRVKNEKIWREATVADVQVLKDRHVQRIDGDIAARRRQMIAITGKTAAVEAAEFYTAHILPLLKERAKLLGLYAPTRLDVTQYIRDWARKQGYDENRAVELAAEVVESQGF